MPSAINRIGLQPEWGNAVVTEQAPITQMGLPARFDLEGITRDRSIRAGARPGWWLASEGNAAFGKNSCTPNLLIQVDARGNVLQQVALPTEVDSPKGGWIRNNGFEGVAVSDDGRYLLAAIQREYARDAARPDGVRYARIARYGLVTDTWDFFLYPLQPTPVQGVWIGLSELVNLGGDRYAVIERDKQVGGASHLKAVYTFRLDGLRPYPALITADADLAGAVITKQWLVDVLPHFAPFEKVEGLTVTPAGQVWVALDNDGGEVEPRLAQVGILPALMQAQGLRK